MSGGDRSNSINTNNHGTTTATASSSREDDTVNRVLTTLANARRERDDLQRRKDLNYERLRLVTEDKNNLEKTVHNMQAKLAELQDTTGKQKEMEQLKIEVQLLTKEVCILSLGRSIVGKSKHFFFKKNLALYLIIFI